MSWCWHRTMMLMLRVSGVCVWRVSGVRVEGEWCVFGGLMVCVWRISGVCVWKVNYVCVEGKWCVWMVCVCVWRVSGMCVRGGWVMCLCRVLMNGLIGWSVSPLLYHYHPISILLQCLLITTTLPPLPLPPTRRLWGVTGLLYVPRVRGRALPGAPWQSRREGGRPTRHGALPGRDIQTQWVVIPSVSVPAAVSC